MITTRHFLISLRSISGGVFFFLLLFLVLVTIVAAKNIVVFLIDFNVSVTLKMVLFSFLICWRFSRKYVLLPKEGLNSKFIAQKKKKRERVRIQNNVITYTLVSSVLSLYLPLFLSITVSIPLSISLSLFHFVIQQFFDTHVCLNKIRNSATNQDAHTHKQAYTL